MGGKVGFLETLLKDVEDRVELSMKDIVQAARVYPIHGLLQALQLVHFILDLKKQKTY